MQPRSQLYKALILIISILVLLISCGGGGSGGGDGDSSSISIPKYSSTDVTETVINQHGEDGGFGAIVLSLDNGYSLQQVVDGVMETGITTSGLVTDASGNEMQPQFPPFDVVAVSLLSYIQENTLATNYWTLEDLLVISREMEFKANITGDLPEEYAASMFIEMWLGMGQKGYSVPDIINCLIGGSVRVIHTRSSGADRFDFQCVDLDGNYVPPSGKEVCVLNDVPSSACDDSEPNIEPVCNNDTVTTDINTPVSITLDCYDPDGDRLTYSINPQPSNGTLSGNAPDLTYTPDSNFSGSDSFGFIAIDGEDRSDRKTISISVNGGTEIDPSPGPLPSVFPAYYEGTMTLGGEEKECRFTAYENSVYLQYKRQEQTIWQHVSGTHENGSFIVPFNSSFSFEGTFDSNSAGGTGSDGTSTFHCTRTSPW